MRRPRDLVPGVHHVVVGAAGPVDYFRDDDDRMTWIRLLVRALGRYDWTCVAFCQLTTHWHALIDVPDESLALGMNWLNSAYSQAFNGRHNRIGYLVRDRYWSVRMATNEQLLTTNRYVAWNPVAAGMTERPELWHWSSFATVVGLANTFPFVDATIVLSQYGPTPALAMAALRASIGPV